MSEPVQASGAGRGRTLLLGGVVGAVLVIVCAGSVPVIGILAAIAIPNFIAMQLKAKRAELPANVDAIKTAELAHDAALDGFVACGTPYASQDLLGKQPHDFAADNAADCMREKLYWQPDGPVRGIYWVTVGGDDFEVHGLSDIDGDGVYAEYVATRHENARMVTPSAVY